MNIDYSLLNKGLEEILKLSQFKSGFKCRTFPGNTAYLTYSQSGIELLFENKKLISIFAFLEGNSKVNKFEGTLPLPSLLSNKDIVSCFGDTKNKGGGIGKGEIWLCYNHLGLKFDIDSKNWNETEAKIQSVCLFEPTSALTLCSVCLKPSSQPLCSCKAVLYCSTQCKTAHSAFHNQFCAKISLPY